MRKTEPPEYLSVMGNQIAKAIINSSEEGVKFKYKKIPNIAKKLTL